MRSLGRGLGVRRARPMWRNNLGIARQGLHPRHPPCERRIGLFERTKTKLGHDVREALSGSRHEADLRKRDTVGSTDSASTQKGGAVDFRRQLAQLRVHGVAFARVESERPAFPSAKRGRSSASVVVNKS